jgi:hypothetical protein
MAGAAVEAVEVLGVEEVGAPDGLGEGLLPGGSEDKVHMIAHQAIADHFDAVAQGLAPQEVEVDVAVVVHEEDVLAVVPALGDVVGPPGEDDASNAWHGGRVAQFKRAVKKNR